MTTRSRLRRTVATIGLVALTFGTMQLTLAPAASAAVLFTDDFTNLSNWTATRVTLDNAAGSPAAPSARAQVTNQSASAFRNLASPVSQACVSTNVNMTSSAAVDVFRLRTSTGGPIIKVAKVATGNLQIRSDFGSTIRNSGVALGTGWHNVELCGTVGAATTWDLYRDGVLIVNDWAANTGTTAIGRVQIGDTVAKTFTANWDHVVADQAPGDEGGGPPGDTTAPTVPGRPAGSSPAVGSIQLSWAASTDPSQPITYRVYRDSGATAIGTTTQTSFTDTNAAVLTGGSSHTYQVDATDSLNNGPSAKSQASLAIVVQSAPAAGRQPVPNHTRFPPPSTARPNMPRITTGDITDLEYIGNRVYVVGNFTQIQNQAPNNTTTYNQPSVAAFNLDTGLVDANFRPTFGGGGVTEIEASPDGTKLYVAGRFNTVNGVTRRKIASINPTTGATVTGFTANANSAASALDATNSTVYVGGMFATINGTQRTSLAALNGSTGAVVPGFINNITGGIGVNGALTVHALRLTHDNTKLLVVHTGRQIAGQDRTGVGVIDTQTNQLLPWRSTIWDDNLQFIGGIQRIFAGDIAPNDQYFVVTSGSGGDRPPISDTAIAFPMSGGPNVQPLWISRCFDSVYSVAITENAVYLGGHYNYQESPTAPDPWPGLTEVGYGRGQGLAGYGLGDDIVLRDHIGAIDPATGKALEWNPGSNSFEGNQAMLALPRGIITGGDGNLQGRANVGRIAVYDFNQIPAPGQNETTIVTPIEGRVEEADVPFVITGNATATSGVNRVQLEVRDRDSGQYLQDNLTTWGTSNTIVVPLGAPNATSTSWTQTLTLSGNRRIQLLARTFGINGTNDASKAEKMIETFGLADATPTTNITGPSGSIIPTTTFTVTGTANDDLGISSISVAVRDEANRYLQDDGDVGNVFNSFRALPDVPGATNATWSYEVTVPYEGEWDVLATAVDTSGQSDLRSATDTWLVSSTAIPPSVTINSPAAMNPPTQIAALTRAPGGTLIFSGTANDDQNLTNVEISLRNTVTRENLASDGTWGTDKIADWHRISTPVNLPGPSYNWTWTTPFTLRPGQYQFSVRATDDLELSTASANQGRLTINVQVPGDAFPDTTISPTGTQPQGQVLHLDLAGTATDDKGVAAVRITVRDNDSGLYVQPNGNLGGAYAFLDTTLGAPNGTTTTWTRSLDLPAAGDYSVTAIAFDASDQQDPSSSGATSRWPMFPGDLPPVNVEGLFSPPNGTVFTDGRIFVSGRFEDDQQMAEAEVAIINSLGQYMSSSGTFTSTNPSWRNAFLTSPGSPGSNFSYTSPVIPAGTYTVMARGVDQRGFVTTAPPTSTVTVTLPPNNPPVAAFTYSCVANVCSFDGRTSTDENAATLTYSWNFGSGQGSGSGPIPTKTYTAAGNPFTVTLTVRDQWNVTATATQSLTMVEPAGNSAPDPVINAPSCLTRVCNFSAVGSADPDAGDTFTYLWNFGDGTTSTSTSPSKTYTSNQTFTVTLTVTDGWLNATTESIQVAIVEPPGNVGPTSAIGTPVCTGLVCNFSGLTSSDPNGDPFTYAWSFGDGTVSTSATPVKTFAAAGTYVVTLITTDGWGRVGTTATVTVIRP